MSKFLEAIIKTGLIFSVAYWVYYAIKSMLVNPYGYIQNPLFPNTNNHSLTILTAIVLFLITYLTLNHLTVPTKVVISGLITLFVNDFRDLLWNGFYLLSVPNLPQYVYTWFLILLGIVIVLAYLLRLLNKDYSIFGNIHPESYVYGTWGSFVFFTFLFLLLSCFLGLSESGFFQFYTDYLYSSGPDPHNLVWALSVVFGFGMWLPLLKLENIRRSHKGGKK